jgi:hypothetical protein
MDPLTAVMVTLSIGSIAGRKSKLVITGRGTNYHEDGSR